LQRTRLCILDDEKARDFLSHNGARQMPDRIARFHEIRD
jgi:hypothetical protein